MSKIRNTQNYAMGMSDLLKNSGELMNQVQKDLKEAENTTYEGRVFTYGRGGPGGVIPFRDASEKAWVALYQSVDVLIDHFLKVNVKAHYERKLKLRELEEKFPDLTSYRFYDRYAARAAHIRNNTNYYTSKDLEFLAWEIGKENELISDIKKLVNKK